MEYCNAHKTFVVDLNLCCNPAACSGMFINYSLGLTDSLQCRDRRVHILLYDLLQGLFIEDFALP